jgi:hypothetical protein
MTPDEKRFNKTIHFLSKYVSKEDKILDLGVNNHLSQIMRNEGYSVDNTSGEDLDVNYKVVETDEYDVVTAFEILEHLVAPFNVLKSIKAKRIVITVPLKLWFSNAYKSNSDPWDRHFHEFEDWQMDWLLEKAGWKVVKTEKWTSPVNIFGIRPLLRKFYPRYYAIYAERE